MKKALFLLATLLTGFLLQSQESDPIYDKPYENLKLIREVIEVKFNTTRGLGSSREMFHDSINTAKLIYIQELLHQNHNLAVTALIYDDCGQTLWTSGLDVYFMGFRQLVAKHLFNGGIDPERIDFNYQRDRMRLSDDEMRDKKLWMQHRRIEFIVFEVQ